MARVLVTAALGNVGREVVAACAAAGLVVRAADLDRGAVRSSFPDAEAACLDFRDPSTWAASLAQCDDVFLLRPPPIADMKRTLLPFIDAAYASGTRHIVFLSVAGADRMKWVPHRKVELALPGHGDGYTILRPGFFAQNLQDAYRQDIVQDDRLYVPAGRGRVAFLDVRDVGAVSARIFGSPAMYRGRTLTLTGPEALDFADVARILSDAVGRPVRYEQATLAGYAWHLRRRRRMPLAQVAVQTVLHAGLRRGDAEAVLGTVEEVLGRPALTLRDYVERSAETWRPARLTTR